MLCSIIDFLLSQHCCAGAVEAMSFLVSSLKGKIQSKSKNLITTCIRAMLRLTTSTEALSIFIDILEELVSTCMESQLFGRKNYDKEHKVWNN